MTTESDYDPDATIAMPRSAQIDSVQVDPALEDEDPEKTLVREDWESTVIRRVALHVAAVRDAVGEDSVAEARFGWEAEGLRRLSREVARDRGEGE